MLAPRRHESCRVPPVSKMPTMAAMWTGSIPLVMPLFAQRSPPPSYRPNMMFSTPVQTVKLIPILEHAMDPYYSHDHEQNASPPPCVPLALWCEPVACYIAAVLLPSRDLRTVVLTSGIVLENHQFKHIRCSS